MAPRAPSAHTATQKEFIVRKLAAFVPPRAISVAFAAVFTDTRCDENDILALDPGSAVVSPELYTLFLSERERVLVDPKSAPYADQRARLIALSNHAEFYANNNQLPEARGVMRQIAEEQGIVGGKGAKLAAAVDDVAEKITAITRTIVDPKVIAEDAHEHGELTAEPK
jgi:hypothetical protein